MRFLTSTASSNSNGSSSNGSAEGLKNALKNMIKSPVFYIVIGIIMLLIIAFYLYRRIVKPRANVVTVVVRNGSIRKLVDEKSSSYFRVPFVDKIGAVISLNERELTSDKLFINNGPDALYQIDYTLRYRVTNPEGFYKNNGDIQNLIVNILNDSLREFADTGNALVLVKDYRKNSEKILELVNSTIEQYHIVANSFKINSIKPLGR